MSLGRNLFFVGMLASSRSHLEDALAVYEPMSHRSLGYQVGFYPHVSAQAYLGNVLLCLGYPNEALQQRSTAIAEARRLAHPPTLAGTLATGIRLHLVIGDNVVLSQWVDQLIAVTTEQGFPHWRVMEIICRGWVKAKNGNVAEGISLLRSGSAASGATGAWVPHNIALLAGACEIAGQIEEAATLLELDKALRTVERTGERWFAAELNRHKGQLLLRHGHIDAAEELYRTALSIAEEQEAKLWELRAAMSLSRLWHDQGKRSQARDLLAPVYGWFTEGFDTADLMKAKALLEEMAP
jgi:predicted ATPase